jgi:hypothetical protein
MKINYAKGPNEAHKNNLKEDILQVLNENFIEMTNQPNKIQEKANPDYDKTKKIFSLRPYHPKCAQSRLVSKAKQVQAWLVLRSRDCSETSSLETKQGIPSKFKWSHWCQTSQK